MSSSGKSADTTGYDGSTFQRVSVKRVRGQEPTEADTTTRQSRFIRRLVVMTSRRLGIVEMAPATYNVRTIRHGRVSQQLVTVINAEKPWFPGSSVGRAGGC
jgi:hypothetical protein